MKSLLYPKDRAAISARLARLEPTTPPRWGRMSAAGMVCHLTDAFRGFLGERGKFRTVPPSRRTTPKQFAVKVFALYLPVSWPKGVRTPPEADQEQGGTPPSEFARDVASLEGACDRFLSRLDEIAERPHFLFGSLTRGEWARWGYRHMDHHLRQFGL
jgi:Protein of unknown function (DUF1569).